MEPDASMRRMASSTHDYWHEFTCFHKILLCGKHWYIIVFVLHGLDIVYNSLKIQNKIIQHLDHYRTLFKIIFFGAKEIGCLQHPPYLYHINKRNNRILCSCGGALTITSSISLVRYSLLFLTIIRLVIVCSTKKGAADATPNLIKIRTL